ncbi:MAG: serine O-acetyltransferase [Magnetococcus sp. YQC-5]
MQHAPRPSFRSLLRADLKRYAGTFKQRKEHGMPLRIIIESFFFKSGFQAVFLFRIASWFYQRGFHYLAWMVTRTNQFLTAAELEYNAVIGPGLMIAHPAGLTVGRGCVLGRNVTLFQNVTLGATDWRADRIHGFPVLGDNVFVFAGAALLGSIRIGNDVVVGANAVVIHDLPDGTLAVGNPARILPDRGAAIVAASGLPDTLHDNNHS